MKESGEYYTKNLYPLQDGILNIVKELKLPFYLTGGTALNRNYFRHRYSDDIDLFVNKDINFNQHIEALYKVLQEKQRAGLFSIDYQRTRRSENFFQLFILKEDVELKIDLVNDIASHYGDFINNHVLGKVDSLRNILSNKLSAIFRYEPKDVVDVWIICKNLKCNLREIIDEAKSKEAGVDPVAIYEILSSFPLDKLSIINWIEKPETEIFKKEIMQIAEDILHGRENSLS
ncbi:MAG: nucleotidyl transferase AbiEii/AbiGii toxin family protein [Ignavibacteriaceae bacterium]|nr:nucleotidyl transferase AbiEii/AbiGii toxin family protein [Ignavibacteriaceae bacterium]